MYYHTPKNQMTKKKAREIFYYKDGHLYWKKTLKYCRRVSNGSIAESYMKSTKYTRVQYNKIRYLCHNIIWNYHYGKIPLGKEIDHINRIRNDNRIENLRLVNHAQNNLNITLQKNNTTGYTGIHRNKTGKKWTATIMINYRNITLGRFNKLENAILARKKAEKKYFEMF